MPRPRLTVTAAVLALAGCGTSAPRSVFSGTPAAPAFPSAVTEAEPTARPTTPAVLADICQKLTPVLAVLGPGEHPRPDDFGLLTMWGGTLILAGSVPATADSPAPVVLGTARCEVAFDGTPDDYAPDAYLVVQLLERPLDAARGGPLAGAHPVPVDGIGDWAYENHDEYDGDAVAFAQRRYVAYLDTAGTRETVLAAARQAEAVIAALPPE